MAHQDSQWITRWLSTPRWEPFLRAAHQDGEAALALYEWNISVAMAFLHDASHAEVLLRNSYNTVLERWWLGDQHWLIDPKSPVNAPLHRMRDGVQIDSNDKNRQSIAEAMRRNHTKHVSPGALVAELPFGFWRHLTDAAHEQLLWIPALHKAFEPHTRRKEVEQHLARINRVRNRAAHNEPFISSRRRGEAIHAFRSILKVEELLNPRVTRHTTATSTLLWTIENPPTPLEPLCE
nr:Abi family protein [Corynebacterium aurimucosum]